VAKIDANNPLTLRVGPDGGSVVSDGLKIDVPAGAVDSKITLTAYPKDRVIDGVTTESQIWSFGPDGQKFNTPITVSFAYNGQNDAATIWWTKEGDLSIFSNLKTTKANSWAVAKVVHFSEGAVGSDTCDASKEEEEGVDCVDGIDAATGEECDGGPTANQNDGEDDDDDGDVEEEDGDGHDNEDAEEGHGSCEHDESQDNDEGEDTDNIEE
jgi:hypothetical protein